MTTVNEIKTKYQFDKRQTGQVVLNPIQKGGFDFRKSGIKDKNMEAQIKREVRAKVAGMPGAETAAYNAKMKRQSKAWFLGMLRNFESTLKKSDDKREIQQAYANMTTKFQEFLRAI